MNDKLKNQMTMSKAYVEDQCIEVSKIGEEREDRECHFERTL